MTFERVQIGTATMYCGDAFEVLPTLNDGEIDMVASDPPYASQTFGKCVDCDWDVPINLPEFWRLLECKAKPQANVALFCNMRFAYDLIDSNKKGFRYDLIWAKNNRVGFLNANVRPMTAHELCLLFHCKPGFSKLATYNPVKTASGRPRVSRTKARKPGGVYPASDSYISISNGEINPISVLAFSHDRGNGQQGLNFHATQKPVNLMGYLIMLYSNPYDLVLDSFMGSGTTAVAAMKLGRRFVGIEKEKRFFDVACRRLEEVWQRKTSRRLTLITLPTSDNTTAPELTTSDESPSTSEAATED